VVQGGLFHHCLILMNDAYPIYRFERVLPLRGSYALRMVHMNNAIVRRRWKS
jgi:hypothetical protein